MNNKYLTVAIFIVSVFALVASVYNIYNTPKIAYVRTAVIIDSYSGMKEAKAKYDQQVMLWQNNIDTLQLQLEESYQQIPLNKEKIRQEEQMLLSYQNAVEEKALEEEQKMMQGVINQINSNVEAYAIKYNYEIILGTTASGNILYGSKEIDITDLVLKELNDNYKK